MFEKEGVNKEQIAREIKSKEELQDEFKEFLADGEVHKARNVIKEARENEIELEFSGEEYKDAVEKAVEDSFRRGYVRHTKRLLEFATDNKISVDLSGDEMSDALSEGFEGCGPQKKEKILEFAKQNQINIET